MEKEQEEVLLGGKLGFLCCFTTGPMRTHVGGGGGFQVPLRSKEMEKHGDELGGMESPA